MKLDPSENEYKCPTCGKYFRRNDTHQKYCCKQCAKPIKKPNPYYIKRQPIEKVSICKYCGKEFITNSWKSNQIYCSVECCDIAQKIKISRDRYVIYERDGFRCFYCGRTSYEDEIRLHVDHVYPKSLGGEDKAYNLVTACEECNLGKSDNPYKYYKRLLRVIRLRNIKNNISPEMVIKYLRPVDE